MCCEQLLCAACGGRVAEARCATCAVSRAQVHRSPGWSLTPELAVLFVALTAMVTVLLRAAA
ncbi:MAG TPA: hypothetical protein VNA12_05290 [Mycobacteriales bacterium]|nr:hypothetical protein [Mycobacteriales bacterium]